MHSQAPHAHKKDDCNLGPLFQLQIPDHKGRQDGKSKVCQDAGHTVHIGECHDDVHRHARGRGVAFTSLVLILVPVMRNWVALEECDEKKSQTGEDGAHRGHVDYEAVKALRCDAEEEPGKG